MYVKYIGYEQFYTHNIVYTYSKNNIRFVAKGNLFIAQSYLRIVDFYYIVCHMSVAA